MKLIASALLTLALAATTASQAAPVSLVTVKTTSGFHGVAVDDATGRVYELNSYNPDLITVYANQTAFAANSPSGSLGLSGGIYGTYFEVHNGKIYGRTAQSGTSVARWDASSGAVETTRASFPGMSGTNGTATFNWGGFSGVNWMSDQNGTYVLGRKADNSGWQFVQVDSNLNTLSTTNIAGLGTLGYAFLINGQLFASDSYNLNVVSKRIDIATGNISAVNFTLDEDGLGINGSSYWDNVSYVSSTNTLMMHDLGSNRYYRVDNAAATFGVSLSNSVPEPSTVALCFIALLVMRTRAGRVAVD